MTPDDYVLVSETPSVEDYLRLRTVPPLSPKTAEAARRGLANTLFAVVLRHEGKVIGMGRVIGDGGCFFQIVDMAVEPPHQGRGLGKRIFGALVSWLDENAPDSAYVSLIADGDARHLYAKFGFAPVTPKSIGMAMRIDATTRRAAAFAATPDSF
ncbi:GNAT family N-acetyltransferase [Aureimonas psammosilenae]|uniref:GNAT family N-acetyltransferase n=1 Tax=Aureimonas psammosilenae TaxID=2495496 RepID=UPI0012605573|nr:GNAT family N-acetyltransferase [Aureimonas psammosilenae]